MKKNITSALFAIAFSSYAATSFAATAFQGNVEVTHGTGGNCALLAETVRLGVSSKVHGAYDCNEETNLVRVAACHEGGSRQTGVACNFLLDDDGNPTDQLPAGCSAQGGTSTIPDYKAFFTSSRGGVMQEQQLGGRCNANTIVGIEGMK
ncbi:hypothetical protein [Stutzerimonas stutzeri]|uniref:hypothetical protein n=1 Tax=Stutzerimonas stutzeri TaxID=316 RepID=UPI000F6FEEE3|nr:hypothetical protein [Stutzerimonas stutzeri]AZL50089.1 hypothetical protein CXB48_21585 [Stutzerimonas stutzeri]